MNTILYHVVREVEPNTLVNDPGGGEREEAEAQQA
jgi:hypothetical protein